jgi:hypothetical protein
MPDRYGPRTLVVVAVVLGLLLVMAVRFAL